LEYGVGAVGLVEGSGERVDRQGVDGVSGERAVRNAGRCDIGGWELGIRDARGRDADTEPPAQPADQT
jgi:hypothetical protein